MEKNIKNVYIYHFALQKKLRQHYKSTIVQLIHWLKLTEKQLYNARIEVQFYKGWITDYSNKFSSVRGREAM